MEGRTYQTRINEIRRVLQRESYQEKLRSKSPEIRPADAKPGEYIIKTGGLPFAKANERPHGIVFRDESYLVVYEKWSKQADSLLAYKYHYQRTDGWFVRYDMEEEQREAHPRHHLQSGALGNVRLPTGEVLCEKLLYMIGEQFVL